MERLEDARRLWRRFEREDKPAFERWLASTFGSTLTQLRELENEVRMKEALIEEFEREMMYGGAHSEYAAFARVQRRHQPPSPEEEAGDRQRPRSEEREAVEEEAEEPSEFEQELMFEKLLHFLGINPDRMSDRQYAKMFDEFKAGVFGKRAADATPEPDLPTAPPRPEEQRIKEIYRVLVRRLHPDARADKDPEVSALWHEVQEAYEQRNLDRLEMLLALTDIQSNTTGGHTTLFQMRAVLEELCTAFLALQRNLRAARKEPAWGFARLANRKALEKKIRKGLESDIAWHEGHLRELAMVIERWATPPRNGRQAVAQEEFSF